jgi:hypothetical protein
MVRVQVEDEGGASIGEAIDVPSTFFPPETDSRFVCLRFVDPYGDTVFNRIQACHLDGDLRLKMRECGDQKDLKMIEELLLLVALCQAEPHCYIRCIGD